MRKYFCLFLAILITGCSQTYYYKAQTYSNINDIEKMQLKVGDVYVDDIKHKNKLLGYSIIISKDNIKNEIKSTIRENVYKDKINKNRRILYVNASIKILAKEPFMEYKYITKITGFKDNEDGDKMFEIDSIANAKRFVLGSEYIYKLIQDSSKLIGYNLEIENMTEKEKIENYIKNIEKK